MVPAGCPMMPGYIRDSTFVHCHQGPVCGSVPMKRQGAWHLISHEAFRVGVDGIADLRALAEANGGIIATSRIAKNFI